MTLTLDIYQSLWAMEQRIPGQPEEAVEIQLSRIADAGYAGACLDPNVDEIDDCLRLKPAFEDRGLNCMVNAFPHDVASLKPLLDMAAEMNAIQVNVIGGVMPLTPAEAVPVVNTWLSMAQPYDFPLLLETHRNGTLNDLFYTLEVLEALPELRLCADLSHFVVDRELQLPMNQTDAQYFSTILDRSDSFQGRISNNQQIQIAIDFPQHREWVTQYRQWWAQGIRGWRSRQHADATLNFLVELGPPAYAITGADQRELSDRWHEGLQIREWVQEIWAECETPDTAA
ncbi:MAG: sugar phosphate isomerase/epimerase [Luminiphilus sp.]|jgi:hypothetical protein|nr:sugar phosphate isomerase/epimerase [Luminiphilus sp.]